MATATNGEKGDESDPEKLVRDASILRTVLLTIIVMATVMTPGNVITFSSIATPQMKLSPDEMSLYNSIPGLIAPLGNLFIAATMDRYGRRIGIFFYIIANTIGWFLVASDDAPVTRLYLGRLFLGIAMGASILPSIVYVAESIAVNNVRIRSTLGTWVIFVDVIGGLLMYILSLSLTYDEVALVFAIFSATTLILILIFIPESPAWLYQRGRIGDADIAQQRLGIKQPILRRTPKRSPTTDGRSTSGAKPVPGADSRSPKTLLQYFAQIRRPDVYKPLMITIGLKFLVDLSGIYLLLSNMVEVITVYPLEISPYVLSLICQVIQIIGCSLLTILLPRFGVKTLCTVSLLSASVGFLLLAVSILYENSRSSNIFNYLHIVSVWAVMLASQLGMLAVPFAILGDLFPMGVKGYATLPLFSDTIFLSIGFSIYPYALTQYKKIVFFVFSVICASGAAFVAAYLPETVGKTMEEISEGFGKKTSRSDMKEECTKGC